LRRPTAAYRRGDARGVAGRLAAKFHYGNFATTRNVVLRLVRFDRADDTPILAVTVDELCTAVRAERGHAFPTSHFFTFEALNGFQPPAASAVSGTFNEVRHRTLPIEHNFKLDMPRGKHSALYSLDLKPRDLSHQF
jgi:hypothetical protein